VVINKKNKMKNLYDILGIKKKASQEEIKQAYKKEIKKHHPDKGGDKDEFIKVNKAYLVLSDYSRRKEYDKTGKTEIDNLDTMAINEIAKHFNEVLKSDKFENLDIIQFIVKYVQKDIKKHEEAVKGAKKTKEKILKYKKRVIKVKKKGNNLFTSVLKEKINRIDSDIRAIKQKIEVFKLVIKKLKDYKDTKIIIPEEYIPFFESERNTFTNLYGEKK